MSVAAMTCCLKSPRASLVLTVRPVEDWIHRRDVENAEKTNDPRRARRDTKKKEKNSIWAQELSASGIPSCAFVYFVDQCLLLPPRPLRLCGELCLKSLIVNQ